MRGRQESQSKKRRCVNKRKGWNDGIAGLEDGKGPQAKDRKQPLEAGKGREPDCPLLPPERMQPVPSF